MNRVKLFSRAVSANNAKLVPRNIHQSGVLASGHEHWHDDGGYDMPFKTDNPYRLMTTFFLFMASGFWYPYFCYHHHRVKQLQMAGLLPKKE